MKDIKPITDEQFKEIICDYNTAIIRAEALCSIIDKIDSRSDELNKNGYRCTTEQLGQIAECIQKLSFILNEVHE